MFKSNSKNEIQFSMKSRKFRDGHLEIVKRDFMASNF